MKTAKRILKTFWDVGVIIANAIFETWEIYLNINSQTSLFPNSKGMPAVIGAVVFMGLVVYAILKRQTHIDRLEAKRANIELVDFGFETKTWGEGEPKNIVAYIEVKSAPNKDGDSFDANRVLAAIDWYDETTGNEFDGRCGRPFVTNTERERGFDLYTMNLDANGDTRKLHFMAIEDNDQLRRAIWRPKDDATRYAEHRFMGDNSIIVTISLRDNNNATAVFKFMSTCYMEAASPHNVYRLEKLDDNDEIIAEYREARLADLFDPATLARIRQRRDTPPHKGDT